MSTCTTPKKTKKAYPNGNPMWLVSYTLDGKQVKKKFRREIEATEHKKKVIQSYIGGIDAAEMDIAKAGYEFWKTAKVINSDLEDMKFLDFLRETTKSYHKPLGLYLEPLVKRFIKIKRDQGLREISVTQLNLHLSRFQEKFDDKGADEITKEDLTEYLLGKFSKSSNRNEIDAIKGFYNWLTGESPKTPIDKPMLNVSRNPFRGWVNARKDKEHLVALFDFDQIKELLLAAANFKMAFYIAWQLHTGMRPTESYKFWTDERYGWKNVNADEQLIFLPSTISKVRQSREIVISDSMMAWIEKYQGEKVFNFSSQTSWNFRYVQLRKGIGAAGTDELRHTRISVMIRLGENITEIEHQLGNSAQIIKNHYLRLMTKNAANKINQITPDVLLPDE
jgi:integrase